MNTVLAKLLTLVFLVLSVGAAPALAQITIVSAANYTGTTTAPEEIVSGFGTNLAPTTASATSLPLPKILSGVTVKVRDSSGMERLASLFYVSPTQINFQIPSGTAIGAATVTVTNGSTTITGALTISKLAPGIFSADSTGNGYAAAHALKQRADNTQALQNVAYFDNTKGKFVGQPIDLTVPNEQMFLQLYGTGIRQRTDLANVTATVGSMKVDVLFAGAQGGYEGLDQINLTLPRALPGGELEVVLKVDGVTANKVKIMVTARSYEPGEIVAVLGSGDPTVSLSKTGARR